MRRLLRAALVLSLATAGATAMLAAQLGRAAEQAQKVARVGFVQPQSPSTATRGVKEFWERLHQLGWVEGQNLVIEERSAEGRYERLPALTLSL